MWIEEGLDGLRERDSVLAKVIGFLLASHSNSMTAHYHIDMEITIHNPERCVL